MKKYILLFIASATVISCATSEKSPYKAVNQSDVPERYVKDFQKKRAEIKDVKWEMADSNTYFANFKSADNDCVMKFTKTAVETYYIIPKDVLPTDITDFINQNYKDYKIDKAYITTIKNQNNYQIVLKKKDDIKKLQFDLTGNFQKVID